MRSACFKKVDEDLKKCFEDAAYMFNETVLRTNDKNSTRKTHFAAAFYNIIQPSGDPFSSSFFIMYLRKAKKFKMITRKMNQTSFMIISLKADPRPNTLFWIGFYEKNFAVPLINPALLPRSLGMFRKNNRIQTRNYFFILSFINCFLNLLSGKSLIYRNLKFGKSFFSFFSLKIILWIKS